jgi:hypothetical protein
MNNTKDHITPIEEQILTAIINKPLITTKELEQKTNRSKQQIRNIITKYGSYIHQQHIRYQELGYIIMPMYRAMIEMQLSIQETIKWIQTLELY